MEGGMKNWHVSTSTGILFYLKNGIRYGHSYNGRRIGAGVQSIEWCHFQWCWVT